MHRIHQLINQIYPEQQWLKKVRDLRQIEPIELSRCLFQRVMISFQWICDLRCCVYLLYDKANIMSMEQRITWLETDMNI